MADWSFLNDRMVERAVNKFAQVWAVKMGSEEDAFSAAVLYISEHPEILKGKVSARIIRMRLARALKLHDYKRESFDAPVVEETMKIETIVPCDTGFEMIDGNYTFEKVASLIWCLMENWEENIDAMRNPFGVRSAPEVKVHTYSDPSHANDTWAEIADVRKAKRKSGITLMEYISVLWVYGEDREPVNDNDRRNADRAVIKIMNYLNG